MEAMVYFARDSVSGLVKVGATLGLKQRLRALSAPRTGRTVTLLAATPGLRPLETQFLRHLWPHHVGGEWFEPAPLVLETAAQVAAGTFDFDALPVGPNPILSAAMRNRRLARTAQDAAA